VGGVAPGPAGTRVPSYSVSKSGLALGDPRPTGRRLHREPWTGWCPRFWCSWCSRTSSR